MKNDKFSIIVNTDSQKKGISTNDLIYFLYNLKISYIAAKHFLEKKHYIYNQDLSFSSKDDVADFRSYLNEIDSEKIYNAEIDGDIDLLFSSISTNSPLTFIGYCTGVSLIALSLSVSIAGGEADLKNQKFKLNGLAKSAINIYKALNRE